MKISTREVPLSRHVADCSGHFKKDFKETSRPARKSHLKKILDSESVVVFFGVSIIFLQFITSKLFLILEETRRGKLFVLSASDWFPSLKIKK